MIVSGAFVVASLVVTASPGPDFTLVCGEALRHGRRSALVTGAGIMTGGVLHASLCVIGVSVLLAASPGWNAALRWGGAAVLCAQGIRSWPLTAAPAQRRGAEQGQVGPAPPVRSSYLTGLACNLLNIRVLMFLAVFLPQFLPRNPTPPALALLAAIYLAIALCWLGIAIELVARMRVHLGSPRVLRHLERLSAAVLIVLGLHMMVAAYG